MLKKNNKTLKISIFICISTFIVFACVVLSLLTYTTYSELLYKSYEDRMEDIIKYVYANIDVEDLSNCVDTGVQSEKYDEMLTLMDSIIESFDIHYLYIVRPVITDESQYMLVIATADTVEGREVDPDGLHLGYKLKDSYVLSELQKYQRYLSGDEITYFKNVSSWGYDYTALKPLVNSKGEHFAALCVDIDVEDVRNSIARYSTLNNIFIVLIGLGFIVIFNRRMDKHVIAPIRKLEKNVVDFAKRSQGTFDPDDFIYENPEIHTENEVESLSDAIVQMTQDMRNQVKVIIAANRRVENMKNQVHEMDKIAYQDALTHVKNKALYDRVSERVNKEIGLGTARFAIVMIDLNNLKMINDTYGHEQGNVYILGACEQICDIYKYSPVYRVGGDEFVVLLEAKDYYNRDDLMKQLESRFDTILEDDTRKPWERFSAAIGMSIYNPGTDHSINDVFKRADALMYQDKKERKKTEL